MVQSQSPIAFQYINRDIDYANRLLAKFNLFEINKGCFESKNLDDLHTQEHGLPAPARTQRTRNSFDQPRKPETLLDKLEERVRILESNVGSFNSTHFCLEYRKLIEEGAQLQLALDKLDISQGPDWKDRRRQGVIKTENLVTTLSRKIHGNGKCGECT